MIKLKIKKVEFDSLKYLKRIKIGSGGEVQRFIDSEVIKQMDPYTPFRDGALKNAPLQQSSIGKGTITQSTPYARRWYYTPANFNEAPRRGNKWFERMKQNHKSDILKGAARIAGAKI